jgi:hypothetical protein
MRRSGLERGIKKVHAKLRQFQKDMARALPGKTLEGKELRVGAAAMKEITRFRAKIKALSKKLRDL